MAGRYDRVGGVWDKVKKRYDKVGGVWTQTKKRYDKVGGVWVPSYTSGIPINYYGYSYGDVTVTPTFTNLSDSTYLKFQVSKATAKEQPYAYYMFFSFAAPTAISPSTNFFSLHGTFNSTIDGSAQLTGIFANIGTLPDYYGDLGNSYAVGANSGTFDDTFLAPNTPSVPAGKTLYLTFGFGLYYNTGATGYNPTIWIPWSAFTWLPTGNSFAYQ